jgi:hypothetical protein
MELLANRLVKQLAIPLINHKTVAKWLVISQQAGKPLVIAMTDIPEHASLSSNTETSKASGKRSERWQSQARKDEEVAALTRCCEASGAGRAACICSRCGRVVA